MDKRKFQVTVTDTNDVYMLNCTNHSLPDVMRYATQTSRHTRCYLQSVSWCLTSHVDWNKSNYVFVKHFRPKSSWGSQSCRVALSEKQRHGDVIRLPSLVFLLFSAVPPLHPCYSHHLPQHSSHILLPLSPLPLILHFPSLSFIYSSLLFNPRSPCVLSYCSFYLLILLFLRTFVFFIYFLFSFFHYSYVFITRRFLLSSPFLSPYPHLSHLPLCCSSSPPSVPWLHNRVFTVCQATNLMQMEQAASATYFWRQNVLRNEGIKIFRKIDVQ